MANRMASRAIGLKRPDTKLQLQEGLLVLPSLKDRKNASALALAVSRECSRKKDYSRLRRLEAAKDRVEAMGGVVGLEENGRTRAYARVLIKAMGNSCDLDLVGQFPGVGQGTIEVKFCDRPVDTECGVSLRVGYYELSLNPNSMSNTLANAPENIAMLAEAAETICQQEPTYARKKQERQERIEALISGDKRPHLHLVKDDPGQESDEKTDVPGQDDAPRRKTLSDDERLNAFGGQRRKTAKELLGVA